MKKIFNSSNLIIVAVFLLAACGSDSVSSNSNPNSISGTLADGYISGAKVCLDLNDDGMCGGGEPSTMTGAGGKFSLDPGVHSKDYPLVSEITPSAIDEDLGRGFESGFTLRTIKGGTFISPLSTLAADYGGTDQSASEADALLKTIIGSDASLNDDYVKKSKGGDSAAAKIHKYAQTLSRVIEKIEKKFKSISGSTNKEKRSNIGDLIANYFWKIRDAADDLSDANIDSVADEIDIAIPDTAAKIKAAAQRHKNVRALHANPMIDWRGLADYQFPTSTGAKYQTWGTIKFMDATITSAAGYSMKLQIPGTATSYPMTFSASDGYWVAKTEEGAASILYPDGTYDFVLSKGGKSAVVSQKKLTKNFTQFTGVPNTKPKVDIVVGTDGKVKSLFWDRDETSDVFHRFQFRTKASGSTPAGSIISDGRRKGTAGYLPNSLKDLAASGLEYRLRVTDTRSYLDLNSARNLPGDREYGWTNFPTAQSNTYIFRWYGLYRRAYEDEGGGSLYPYFPFAVANPDAVKRIRIIENIGTAGAQTLYDLTANISFSAKTCAFGNPPTVSGDRVENTGTRTTVKSSSGEWLRTFRCYTDGHSFTTKDGVPIVNFGFHFQGDNSKFVAGRKYTLVLLDNSGNKLAQVSRILQDVALTATPASSLNLTESKGFLTFAWQSSRYSQLEFGGFYYASNGSTSGHFSFHYGKRSLAKELRIHKKSFYALVKKEYCDKPATDAAGNTRAPLYVRVSAYDQEADAAINTRRISGSIALNYGCTPDSVPTKK